MERSNMRSFVSTSRWAKHPKPSARERHSRLQRLSCETPLIFKTAFKTASLIPSSRQTCYGSQPKLLHEDSLDNFMNDDQKFSQKLTIEKVFLLTF